jgi:hypothetical protein
VDVGDPVVGAGLLVPVTGAVGEDERGGVPRAGPLGLADGMKGVGEVLSTSTWRPGSPIS